MNSLEVVPARDDERDELGFSMKGSFVIYKDGVRVFWGEKELVNKVYMNIYLPLKTEAPKRL